MPESNPSRQPLLVATRNVHKTMEIRSMLGPDWSVQDLMGKRDLPAVEETGRTFAENAALKALTASIHSPKGWVLADDSGLEIDVLGGAPGVYSARFAGPDATDEENRLHLADELRSKVGAGWDRPQAARFRCSIALAWGGEIAKHFDGTVEGVVVHPERGQGGFGYDPVFVPSGYQQTFAELPAEIKNRLSHRAQAVAKAAQFLRAIVG